MWGQIMANRGKGDACLALIIKQQIYSGIGLT